MCAGRSHPRVVVSISSAFFNRLISKVFSRGCSLCRVTPAALGAISAPRNGLFRRKSLSPPARRPCSSSSNRRRRPWSHYRCASLGSRGVSGDAGAIGAGAIVVGATGAGAVARASLQHAPVCSPGRGPKRYKWLQGRRPRLACAHLPGAIAARLRTGRKDLRHAPFSAATPSGAARVPNGSNRRR
jgi:hypothetical protein